ncbi:MAG: YeeE/YedE family protein [Pseudomonadota bacterium]
MAAVLSLFCGLLFGLGLLVSGMANPAKVLNFLDVLGPWDPSLAFVMGGAIVVTAPGFWLLRRRSAPHFAPQFNWPTKTDIDGRLLSGAALFGTGWGLVGFCPGPAITAVSLGNPNTFIFVAAMLAGMAAARALGQRINNVVA